MLVLLSQQVFKCLQHHSCWIFISMLQIFLHMSVVLVLGILLGQCF